MKNVFVGLSGGVDSAVSAALLKEQGYNVTGAFIKIWQPEFIECTWEKDRLDAMRVCAALEIPFKEIDLSNVYKEEVISDLINGYRRGVTPNPDVLCNSKVKFGSFLEWAKKEGAHMLATGHYARVKKENGSYLLLRGVDSKKDQSYFLWQLHAEDLAHVLFPVGDMKKTEVREHAQRFQLPVAQKHDSQGLCFVGDITMSEFLGRYIPLKPGDVVDKHGTVIGTHEGASLYTLGQRHGFMVENNDAAAQPQYCVAIDTEKNTITTSSEKKEAMRTSVRVIECSWVHDAPMFPFTSHAQVRYRETPVAASIKKDAEGVQVTFEEPRIATPGQSLVFYDNERLLGGGIIVKN